MKVVCTRLFIDADLDYIRNRVPNIELVVPHEFSEDGILDACKNGVDVFLGQPPSLSVLTAVASEIEFIQIPWAGVEAIDFDACRNLGVTCLNSHSNSECVAEMAVGLLFSLLKKIPYHNNELKQGRWHRPADSEGFFPPILLKNMNVGYFGFGEINKCIHKMLSGFKINHFACVNSYRDINDIKVFNLSTLTEFVSNCDIIFIGAPLTEKTFNLFDDEIFNKFKNDSYLINISRAKIVNEKSLVNALNNKIAGAAFDVWYNYPKRGESRCIPCSEELLECENMLMSPHRAGYVKGNLPHLDDVVENLISATTGGELKNIINLEDSY